MHASVHADAKAEVPITLTVQDYLVRGVEHRRIAVGHSPRDPQPLALLELDAVDVDVVAERAAVAGSRGEVAQKLFRRRIEQRVALAAEQGPLVGVLGEPLKGVRR